MNWCYECECKASDCPCGDWHRHYKTNNKGIGGKKSLILTIL